MGRHARETAHLRVSASTIVLGTLIVTVVAVGSLLSSHAQPTPIAAEGVVGTAVVVSSLACQDGAGGTLVDVLNPAGLPAGTTVRASLDACGYQEGEQLVVQFAAGDPTRVTVRGNPVDETATGGPLLPYGLVLAALLAMGAAIAVWIDARRGRGARARTGPVDDTGARMPATETPEIGSIEADVSASRWSAHGAPSETVLLHRTESPGLEESHRPGGRHARPDADLGDVQSPDPSTSASPMLLLIPQPVIAAVEPDEFGDRVGPDRELSTVDLSFPFTASLADCLHDELFTHRTAWS